jgi:hypothetical protein
MSNGMEADPRLDVPSDFVRLCACLFVWHVSLSVSGLDGWDRAGVRCWGFGSVVFEVGSCDGRV